LVRSVVADLLTGGLVHEVLRGHDRDEGGLVPARDLQHLTVHDLILCLRYAGSSTPRVRDTDESREAEAILATIDEGLKEISAPLAFSRIVEVLSEKRDAEPVTAKPVELFKRR
jgi:hypothetical protein